MQLAVSQVKKVMVHGTAVEAPVSKKIPIGTEQIEIEPLVTALYNKGQSLNLLVQLPQFIGQGTQTPIRKN